MEKLIKIVTILLLGILSLNAVQAFDCSSAVKEVNSGLLNWVGEVEIIVPVDTSDQGWIMTLTYDQEFTFLGTWELFVREDGKQRWAQFTPRAEYGNVVLKKGEIFTFRFQIRYGREVTKPILNSINFQGIELCK